MKLDLHVHSSFSTDGTASPREILKEAKRMGLGGLCITDHNTIAGSLEARKIASEFGIIVVSGMEISSAGGHLLAYGISDEIPRDLSPAETVDRIHGQGGLAVIPHPYRFWSGLGEETALGLKPDAIEVQNAHSTARENAKAGKLALRMKLPGTAGSDSHEIESLARAWTVIPEASTENEVLMHIKSGRLKAGGRSRKSGSAFKDRAISVAMWAKRGFRKM